MATVRDVLHNYFKLRDFCDSLREAVVQRYGDQIACRPGCSKCCTLEGVNMLEATVLLRAIHDKPDEPVAAKRLDTLTPEVGASCILLRHDLCSLYAARPIICRTHGLPLRGHSLTGGRVDCCPMNFVSIDLTDIQLEFILDVDEVTMNLMRLNLAFCMILGDRLSAGVRVSLKALLTGEVPPLLGRTIVESAIK